MTSRFLYADNYDYNKGNKQLIVTIVTINCDGNKLFYAGDNASRTNSPTNIPGSKSSTLTHVIVKIACSTKVVKQTIASMEHLIEEVREHNPSIHSCITHCYTP